MKCEKKTSLICRILRSLIFIQLTGLFFVPIGISQPLEMTELLEMWRAEQYREVIPPLIDYRNRPYGKNVQIDYMIATSCCRIDELSDIGQRYFNRILSSYELSDNDAQLIRRERERCSESIAPTTLAFLNNRTAMGSDVGVRGKTYFHADRENAPIGTDLIKVVRDIPIETFQARLFPPSEGQSATEKIRSLVGADFQIESTTHFTIAATSGRTKAQMAAIGQRLEKSMAFFHSEFGIPLPRYRVSVYITSSQHQLSETAQRIHGLQLARGSIGYSHRDDLSICAVAGGSQVGTLKHELFHLMVRNNYGDIPPWLDEGLASLYEVSRFEGPRLIGLRNWREDIVKHYRQDCPALYDLVAMPWSQFNAKDEVMYKQAINHATARYFVLYLQDMEKLDDVFTAFQQLDIAVAEGTLAQQAVHLLERVLDKSVDQVENDFAAWLDRLGHNPSTTDIKRIQRRLNEKGYQAGVVDGLVGPQTRTALKAFQTDHDLAPTGRIDNSTWDMFQAPAGFQ